MKRQRNSKGQFKSTSKVSEFGFVNLSTYTSPEIKEVSGKDWIEYGADNNYPYLDSEAGMKLHTLLHLLYD